MTKLQRLTLAIVVVSLLLNAINDYMQMQAIGKLLQMEDVRRAAEKGFR